MKLKAKRVIFKHFIPQLNSAMTEYFCFVLDTSDLKGINYEVISQLKRQGRGCFTRLLKKSTKCFLAKGHNENKFFFYT